MHHFSTVEAIYQFHIVFLLAVIFTKASAVQIGCMVVRFLDATSGWGVITGDSQADHRAIGQFDGTLYQPFTKSTATYNYASVPVLYGTGYDFTC